MSPGRNRSPILLVGIALWALQFLPGCVTVRAVPRAVRLSSPTVELPVERSHGVFFVEAMIEGKGPFRLVVDTGAGVLTLTPAVVEAVGLETSSYPWRLQGASGSKWGWLRTGRVKNLRIGDHVEIDSMKFVEHPLPLGADGLLGNGILDHCAMVIDPRHQRMWLTTDATSPLAGDVQIRLLNAVPTVPVKLGERTVRATLDTGCAGTLDLPRREEARLTLESGGGSVESYSIHGSHWLSVRRYLGSVQIGSIEIDRPFLRFGEGPALIGLPLFRGKSVRIDLRTMTLRVGSEVEIPGGTSERPAVD